MLTCLSDPSRSIVMWTPVDPIRVITERRSRSIVCLLAAQRRIGVPFAIIPLPRRAVSGPIWLQDRPEFLVHRDRPAPEVPVQRQAALFVADNPPARIAILAAPSLAQNDQRLLGRREIPGHDLPARHRLEPDPGHHVAVDVALLLARSIVQASLLRREGRD